ncbi:MAG: FHA domain-containing protein [candidate division Zixibacteria bacterium]|nr:FHA domain-containing protein [candidate division Zixibacteria bacterium]
MIQLAALLALMLPLVANEAAADGGGIPWLWIIIGVVVLAVVIIGIIAYRAGGELDVPIRLVVTAGTHTGTAFPLTSAYATIGTEKDNDIVVNDDKVSKHHARLTYAKSTLSIADANSLYGTFVNGERIEKADCKDGDVIGLGTEFECRVELPK